ncbi:hypothetical protein KCU59_g114, partial [Aureobasidium melanogenum]
MPRVTRAIALLLQLLIHNSIRITMVRHTRVIRIAKLSSNQIHSRRCCKRDFESRCRKEILLCICAVGCADDVGCGLNQEEHFAINQPIAVDAVRG